MFKVINADLRKLIFHAGFRSCIIFVSVYLGGYTLLMKLITHFVNDTVYADELIACYGSVAVLLISACTLVTTVSDYADGCIRNKLISGAGRNAVFLSACISGAIQAIILSVTALIASVIFGLLFTDGLGTMTFTDLADRWLVISLAGVSIAVFSTMLIMLLGGKKSAYTAGIATAVGLNIFSLEVMDKLYPENGVCTLSGMKLKLYSFYDSYVPYAYPAVPVHHGMEKYLLGAFGMIAVSVIIGLVIFNRKEIQ